MVYLRVIYLHKGKAKNTRKSGYALYIGFTFDTKTIQIINKMRIKYYHRGIDMWEVPYKQLDDVMFAFSDFAIISNDKKIKEEIKRYKKANRDILGAVTELPYSFKTKPFAHQVAGFQYAETHNRFLLADDQGLGKTKQSLDIALSRKKQFKHCLIICGVNSLKWNWKEEIKTHTNEASRILGTRTNRKGRVVQDSTKHKLEDLQLGRDEFFLITNGETLRNVEIVNILQDMIYEGEIGMVIIDEIHKMKNSQSLVGKEIHKLNSYYKMALTGTPLMNDAIDLYNILKWLGEETGTLGRFKYRYCVFGGFGGYKILGYRNLDELRGRLDDVQLRRMKEDVFDLPPKIHTNVYVELTSKQRKLYNNIEQELIEQINEILLSPNPLAKLTRLRQVTSYPPILDPDVGMGAKMEQILEDVDEVISQGHKVIIFSNWTSVVDGLMEELKRYKPLEITGAVSSEIRQAHINEFQKDETRNLIIGTIGAMGTGITLSKGSYVMFVEEPWNQANKLQAEDRAHRIGTTQTVHVRTYITKGTIDEKINELVYGKGNLSKYLVDGDVDYKPVDLTRLVLGLEEKGVNKVVK